MPGPAQLEARSPIDGEVFCRRPLADGAAIDAALAAAEAAFAPWRATPLTERIARMEAFLRALRDDEARIVAELALQMGRPVRYGAGELGGVEERTRTMCALAPTALGDLAVPAREGFTRFVRRTPVGPVLVLAPWNYPYLTAVNAIVPALLAGNPVILKHSSQTPLVAERFQDAFDAAGLPPGVFQHLHADHEATTAMVGSGRIRAAVFTGSVAGGAAVERAAAGHFIPVGLELGGKDPAWVRADADLDTAVAGVLDGVFFNSGQSCCGIERIYVHRSRFDEFVERAREVALACVLGDPRAADTTMGPMVRASAADAVRVQIDAAVAAGARTLVDADAFPRAAEGGVWLAPQLLVDVDHSMALMQEENFGPVAGIMAVDSDDEAVALMNDSPYGLTASVWTRDLEAAIRLGDRIETGTVFMNRCDYLDPELVWTGVKNSGRGTALSVLGFDTFTRPRSFHLRHR
ncbi:MAG TPA: aldehyde dehydrogenase family protein [Pseudomonadales bacterium]|nr:aldehyde dehydrogenase family protein [Pseudomonadales bacterium]